MVSVLFLAGLVVLGVRVLRLPSWAGWIGAGLIVGAVVLAHLVLPAAHPFRAATGGSAASWTVLLGAVSLGAVYGRGLRWLRARAKASARPPGDGTMSDAELERYARHLVLHEIGGQGQQRLRASRVLVVGAGGLGSPALLYLAAAGVGTIGCIDDDAVSLSNLQRQVIHTDGRIDMAKVFSAERAIAALNPHVTFRPYNRRLVAADAPALFADYDLILDGSDNFETRYLVNSTAVAARVPLISAAIGRWEGQIGLYDPAHGTACYQCVFPEAPAEGLVPACAEAGVVGALPGVVGAMMALEAIKQIAGAGASLAGKLMLYDGLNFESRVIATRPRPDCPVCGMHQDH